MFRRRQTPEPTRDPWTQLLEALGLVGLPSSELDALRESLPMDLALVGDAAASLREVGAPRLVACFVQPTAQERGPAANPRPAFLLQGDEAHVSAPAFRVFAHSHPLVTSLQASRTGGSEWPVGDDAFDARLAVVARDPAIATWLADARATPLRRILMELLVDSGAPDAVLIVGSGQVTWHAQRPTEVAGTELEAVAEQLFGVWAGLRAAGS